MQHQHHQHPYGCCPNGEPHAESGDYLVSWLDALSAQGTAWYPALYPDHPRSSQHWFDARTIVTSPVAGFSSNFHQGSSDSYHYRNHPGTDGAHSNSHTLPLCHHNTYPPVIPQHNPLPTFYEGQSPELPIYQAFPSFDFVDADSMPSMSSSPAATDTDSVSTSTSGRQKTKIELAPDQPLTVDGNPRKRVFVACDRCSAVTAPTPIAAIVSGSRIKGCSAPMSLHPGDEDKTRRPAYARLWDRGSRGGLRYARSAVVMFHDEQLSQGLWLR
ncbi:hypothetical protein DICSQDRAFT_128354 [Dichomitus squalens LYAD-421 SS1]|uniref:Uncharacterized protein n=1 Tax=Dichomitus squalens (strain LYAD-421) TaxID=732165 RepID=R7STV7_DICSQ|nr:uncharacterized protein DICSQDRAFT_128354 [Dichomitus squalens LYAD-421 SS1]EJF59338.1 hypothetical protein DICSQDRAFT_128354 [Dichomitus squalens LYAD-421 SS1]